MTNIGPIIYITLGIGLTAITIIFCCRRKASESLETISTKKISLYARQNQILNYITKNPHFKQIENKIFTVAQNKPKKLFVQTLLPKKTKSEVEPLLHSVNSDSSITDNISVNYSSWIESSDIASILTKVGVVHSDFLEYNNNRHSDFFNSFNRVNNMQKNDMLVPSNLTPEDKKATLHNTAETLELANISPSTVNFDTIFGVVCSSYESELHLQKLEQLLDTQASIAFDRTIPDHERKLMELWAILTENTPIPDKNGKHWQRLGFQGFNPSTDFRSTGTLGLDSLLYFAKKHPAFVREIMQFGEDEGIRWFSFAITGINITSVCQQLLRDRKVNIFFLRYGVTLETFYELYITIFSRLQFYWKATRPDNMMQFGPVLKKVLEKVAISAERDELVKLYV